MADFKLDNGAAAIIATTLYCLADMVEQPPGSLFYLTDVHMNGLTSPPGLAISRDRAASAANLRARARMIEVQLGDDATTTDGPYALHTEHPPPGTEAARLALEKASRE